MVHRHLASSGSHLQVRTAVVFIDIGGHRFGLSGTSAYEPITCTNSGTYINRLLRIMARRRSRLEVFHRALASSVGGVLSDWEQEVGL